MCASNIAPSVNNIYQSETQLDRMVPPSSIKAYKQKLNCLHFLVRQVLLYSFIAGDVDVQRIKSTINLK